MNKLSFPFSEEKIRALKVGDEVLISGTVFTGRDAVHKYLHEGGELPPGVKLHDGIIYHCGPVMMKQPDGSYQCTAAGPTTSIREEPYQWQVIRDFGLRGVVHRHRIAALVDKVDPGAGHLRHTRDHLAHALLDKAAHFLG